MKASIGRIVHYVGESPFHRAAVVTEVHTQGVAASIGAVSLAVFEPTGLVFTPHVPYDDRAFPGTWHWPERSE